MKKTRPGFSRNALAISLLGALLAAAAFGDDFAMGTNVDEPGKLYQINLSTLATSFVTDTTLATTSTQPNAQAWDNANKRFYYAEVQTGRLWVWLKTNDGTPNDDHYLLGDLSTTAGFPDLTCPSCGLASAAFYSDSYYTIPDGTDDLWEVTLIPSAVAPFVAIGTVAKIADLTANARAWGFGDVAVDFNTGVLYGSGQQRSGGFDVEFFSYDLTGPGPFSSIKVAAAATYPRVQLTFNQPFDTLYAFDSNPGAMGEVSTVNLATGDYTSQGNPSPEVRFRDVGGASNISIPVELMDFTVTDR